MMKVGMRKTTCKTPRVQVGASGGRKLRLHSHQEIPTTDPLSEVFCQGLLYVFLRDWFVCTCMCRGHIHLSYIYMETKRGHQVLLYHSLTPFRQSFPVNLLELASKPMLPLPLPLLNPVLGLQAQASTPRVYVGVFVGPQVCALTP